MAGAEQAESAAVEVVGAHAIDNTHARALTLRAVTGRSIALFVAAAICEIGGAYLVWIAIKDDRGLLLGAVGAIALVAYGVVAAFQPESEFGRVLAAYGGVFIVGSLVWGVAFDGFRPDRYDLGGAAICLLGVTVIMYVPR
jgi:small multidrug resistance family-3 protein